jgi:hypothetical protein
MQALNKSVQRAAILLRLDVRATPCVADYTTPGVFVGGTTLHRSAVFIRLELDFSQAMKNGKRVHEHGLFSSSIAHGY